jgi:SPP1 family predicted phage head-tail adaptor
MESGKLRHRLILQTPTITKNDYQEPVRTWANTANLWGSVEPLSGREYEQAMKLNSEITGKIRIRYRAGIKPTLRFKFGDQIFEIMYHFLPDNRKIEIHCWVKEVIDNG